MAKRAPRKNIEHGNCPTGNLSDTVTFLNVLRWYNTVYDDADANKALLKYVRDNYPNLGMISDTKISQNTTTSLGIYAKMIQDGLNLSERSVSWFKGALEKVLVKLVAEAGAQKAAKKPLARTTAQDKLSNLLADIDAEIDNYRSSEFNAYNFYKAQEVSGPMIKTIVDTYGPLLEELELAKSGKDEQVKEAYAKHKSRDLTKLIKLVRMIVEDAERLTELKKATRVRKPRARKAVDVTNNITPMKEDTKLKIVSINPSKVVGSQVAYLYLVKYNQMVEVHAASDSGLTFSGKSLVGWDENKTRKKGLRKETDTLATFSKHGKISARRQFEAYRGKEQNVSGKRININEQVAILKAF